MLDSRVCYVIVQVTSLSSSWMQLVRFITKTYTQHVHLVIENVHCMTDSFSLLG